MKKVPGLGNGISHLPPSALFFFFFLRLGTFSWFCVGVFSNVYDADGERQMCQSEGSKVPFQPTRRSRFSWSRLYASRLWLPLQTPLFSIEDFPTRKNKSLMKKRPDDSLPSAWGVWQSTDCVSTEDYVFDQLAHVSPYFNVELFFFLLFFFFFPISPWFFFAGTQSLLGTNDFISSSSQITTPHPCYPKTRNIGVGSTGSSMGRAFFSRLIRPRPAPARFVAADAHMELLARKRVWVPCAQEAHLCVGEVIRVSCLLACWSRCGTKRSIAAKVQFFFCSFKFGGITPPPPKNSELI